MMNKGGVCARAAATVLALLPVWVQPQGYSPPRLLHAVMPPLPAANVVGGGEVMIEVLVDERGMVTQPTVVRSTPPFTEMLLAVVVRWRFAPARVAGEQGGDRAVAAPVMVSAIYRPPAMLNAPAPGHPPEDRARPSPSVSYPVATILPDYPPNALTGSVVLYEVALDESGRMIGARRVAGRPGFERAARTALAAMRFRGARYGQRAVPSITCVLFGFRPPVVSSVR